MSESKSPPSSVPCVIHSFNMSCNLPLSTSLFNFGVVPPPAPSRSYPVPSVDVKVDPRSHLGGLSTISSVPDSLTCLVGAPVDLVPVTSVFLDGPVSGPPSSPAPDRSLRSHRPRFTSPTVTPPLTLSTDPWIARYDSLNRIRDSLCSWDRPTTRLL